MHASEGHLARPSVGASTKRLTVPEQFETRVREDPDAIAITDTAGVVERRLTFGDLNTRANRVAGSLLEMIGFGPGRVGIVLEDNIDVVTCLFGVMKAGKTFVPLDPGNPPARLRGLLDHAGVEATVSDGMGIPGTTTARTLSITSLIEAGPPDDPNLSIDPAAPVRIMYTSGSTGRPKGVVHSHQYLMDKTAGDRSFLDLAAADRLSQTLPLSFAASTGHTFGALLNGGTLCFYDPLSHGIQGFAEWLDTEQLTGLLMIPALFRRFLESVPSQRTFPTLRYVMVGGDRVTHRDVELFRRHFSTEAVFIHRFAATECGPIAYFVITSEDEVPESVVPIGYPAAGRKVLILDDAGREVAPGRTAEMHLQAHDLAEGYWDEPDLTAAAFRPGPDGSRIFHTGDLGRVAPAGYLEHLGRKDQRVKVHGYGVDILEVEKALLDRPEVAEAVVIARYPEMGETSLAGYVVARPESRLAPDALRADLADLLPTYSIPAHLVVLDQMPLTPRGKIDRNSLPEPVAPTRTATPPSDALERDLLAVWEEKLGLTGIGVTDDFFELGGTSVRALEVFAVIADRLGHDVPPSTLFEAPTVDLLAKRIRAGEWEPTERSLIPIRTKGHRPPVYCVHGGGGGVFFAREIAQYLRPDRPVYGIQAAGFESTAPPQRSVEELAALYAAEIQVHQPDGRLVLAGLSFGGLVAIEMAEMLVRSGREITVVVLLDTKHPSSASKAHSDGDRRHARRMATLNIAGKIGYVAGGAWKRYVRRPLRRRQLESHIRRGEPIPVEGGLRHRYFWSMHAAAARAHRPRQVEIPLVMIGEQGSLDEHGALWGPLATAGLQVTEVHGNHDSLAREPVIVEVAEILQAAMDEADDAGDGR